jgi:hypothetical protein
MQSSVIPIAWWEWVIELSDDPARYSRPRTRRWQALVHSWNQLERNVNLRQKKNYISNPFGKIVDS